MPECLRLSKLEVAQRQLNVAIRLLFANDDPVAVHTLVGAASTIFSDLVEVHHPSESWDKHAQEANSLTPKAYFRIMRKAQNWFKHATDDPDSVLDFDPIQTDSVIFGAVMNAFKLAPLSNEAAIYAMWYITLQQSLGDLFQADLRLANDPFGDLRSKTRLERLNAGQRALLENLLVDVPAGG
jgi:hypothetical protein